MAVSDTIGDYLTCIRNAYRSKKDSVTVPGSKLKIRLAELLKQEGYIKDFAVVDQSAPKKFIHIKLRYLHSGKPAVLNLQRVSTPGLHSYVPMNKIPKVLNGLGTMIVSTSQGLMTDDAARKSNLGGELICKVW